MAAAASGCVSLFVLQGISISVSGSRSQRTSRRDERREIFYNRRQLRRLRANRRLAARSQLRERAAHVARHISGRQHAANRHGSRCNRRLAAAEELVY